VMGRGRACHVLLKGEVQGEVKMTQGVTCESGDK